MQVVDRVDATWARRVSIYAFTFVLTCAAIVAVSGCDRQSREDEESSVDTDVDEFEPSLPARPGEHAPSFARSKGGHGDRLAEVDACTECHAEQVSQWRDSMHALASFNNPFYRKAFDDFDAQAGREKTRFCAGCHDPAVMFDTGIEAEIEPSQPNAHAGVTCGVCHGAVDATRDGNGSYVIEPGRVRAPADDTEAAIAKHRREMSTEKVEEEALCVSCHRGFIDHRTGHRSDGDRPGRVGTVARLRVQRQRCDED